jgi:hypothetical protein
MKVNILGTEYKIVYEQRSANPKYENCNGYCDSSVKEIHLCDMKTDEADIMAIANMDAYRKRALRHEIIHAFMEESGLSSNSYSPGNWADNEEMIDWIAIQFPKMLKVFQETSCL